MKMIKSSLAYRSLTLFMTGAVLWALCLAGSANAQSIYRSAGIRGTIDPGTMITVRTNETINANQSDGRIFSGVVDQDVLNRNGSIAIPRGSPAELIVRKVSNNDVAVDLDSVMVNGERYGVETDENVVSSDRKEGLGVNKRTGEYVGGGAVLGAIIGAIAGGGKGAAIGAGAGAATGAGVQVLTRGKRVDVPAESLLTFQLSEPLRAGVVDRGYTQNGVHYHSGYSDVATQSTAYRDGFHDGRLDADRNNPVNMQSYRWRSERDRRDYVAGYNDAYYQQGAYNNGRDIRRSKPGYSSRPYGEQRWNISIGNDKNIYWDGPESATVYVQVDNEAPKLFAAGRSGTQSAPWITQGHLYTFILRDANGNEITRVRHDLRSSYRR